MFFNFFLYSFRGLTALTKYPGLEKSLNPPFPPYPYKQSETNVFGWETITNNCSVEGIIVVLIFPI